MLHLLIKTQDTLFNDEYLQKNSDFFDMFFSENRDCLQDPLIQEILEKIEKCKLSVGGYLETENNILFSPFDLSSGVKSLILLKCSDYKINGSQMGDNCYPYVMKIAECKDIYLHLGYIPNFGLKADSKFEALILNKGYEQKITTWKEFISIFVKITSEDAMSYEEDCI